MDFEYTTSPTFTSYSPAGASVTLFNSFLLLYGSPIGSSPAKLELIDVASADVCYSSSCPSTTPLYPSPNYVLNVGQLVFSPNAIVPGTGVSSLAMNLTLNGDIAFAPPPTIEIVTAAGTPVLFTGLDPGGASSYAYFQNADGTFSNTHHVLQNTTSTAFLTGVILDPPGALTLDILGFTSSDPNSFITAPVPEPGSAGLVLVTIIVAMLIRRLDSQIRI
jgi:hypothetical protein